MATADINGSLHDSRLTALDAAVLNASQILSSSTEDATEDELLRQVVQTILQVSDADRCALLLDNQQNWQLRATATAEATAEGTQLCSTSIDSCSQLPIELIHTVQQTHEAVVADAIADTPTADRDLRQACLPLLNRGQLLGIACLDAASAVFTGDRLLILNFLCTQAAVLLDNARLHQKIQELQVAQPQIQPQSQFVQNEKMATLGSLMVGVAHEVNNPIGFLNGSISNAQDYVHNLLEHLALYQQHCSPIPQVQRHAEEIDLEFLNEDLPKLLNSMEGALERIKSISTSLRIFARADTDYKISANLHEGLESTLLILKYRLSANQNRAAIKIVKEYGELPQIECFPGQLNQVFMNIFANAIDLFDEMAQTHSPAELKANPQQITLQTKAVGDRVQIIIRDNGAGMTEAVKAKLFNEVFTTKAVGKGTGLGLTIAHEIVVKKHGGSIEVNSTLGQGTEFVISLPLGSDSDF